MEPTRSWNSSSSLRAVASFKSAFTAACFCQSAQTQKLTHQDLELWMLDVGSRTYEDEANEELMKLVDHCSGIAASAVTHNRRRVTHRHSIYGPLSTSTAVTIS